MGKNTKFKPQEPSTTATNAPEADPVATHNTDKPHQSELSEWEGEILTKVQDLRDPKQNKAIKLNNDDLRRILDIFGYQMGKGGLGTRADRLLAESYQFKLINLTILNPKSNQLASAA